MRFKKFFIMSIFTLAVVAICTSGNYAISTNEGEAQGKISSDKVVATAVKNASSNNFAKTTGNDEVDLKLVGEDPLACHGVINYKDQVLNYLVTSSFAKENFYFENGKELHVKIGSMSEGPSAIIYISDAIELGKTYTMKDTGFSFMNSKAVFNAGFSYRSMFSGYVDYAHNTIPGILGYPLESATLCVNEWDRSNGIISGTLTLGVEEDVIYTVSFTDHYLASDHPTRDEEYIASLMSKSTVESGQYIPKGFQMPDASELFPKEIPCHYCSNGKAECTMCVGGTTLQYKQDLYEGPGRYVEIKCPKCGGVGWVKCPFCYGDGTITVTP